MEASTFKDAEVTRRLAGFVFIKYQAEQPNAEPAKAILDRYGAVGLPTYVVLRPK
jgi:thiol:disulfide interchange protein